MTTTDLRVFQMADEFDRHAFDVYSREGFVGHFRAESVEDAKAQAAKRTQVKF